MILQLVLQEIHVGSLNNYMLVHFKKLHIFLKKEDLLNT